MRSKTTVLSNFSQAIATTSSCYRPDSEAQLSALVTTLQKHNTPLLARGQGLSYSDCCVSDGHTIINNERLNHFLSFDPATGTVVCQAGVTFAELFLIDPNYIPPVIPGTLHATLAGGVANDVHGKNNPLAGTLGQHIQWLELQVGEETLRCSMTEHKDLFQATIGGLGLTGIIKKIALTLRPAPHFVRVQTEQHQDLDTLMQRMQQEASHHHYQVAWLDLLNTPKALLSFATSTDHPLPSPAKRQFTIPPLPIRCISKNIMRLYNHFHFHKMPMTPHIEPLQQFNNPLDAINHWTRLYGKKGLRQFQCIVDENIALTIFHELFKIIQQERAIPTLAVLKYFTQPGPGLLSFVQPGFTLAIDFINTARAQTAIAKMNELITNVKGKIYLAKDLLLTASQFNQQYMHHQAFKDVLHRYPTSIHSDLSRRLGLTS